MKPEFTEARIKNIRWAIENKQTDDALMIDMLDEIQRLQSRVQELECQLKSKQIVIESKEQTIREFAEKMLDLRKR